MASKGRELGNIVSPKTGIAVTFSGDPVILGVGNTESVRITGGGLVGINTNDPQKTLHVNSSDDNSFGIVRISGKNRGGQLEFCTDTTKTAGIYSPTSSNELVFFTSSSETERLRITSAGLIGIANTTPEEILDLGDSFPQNLKVGLRGYLGQSYSTSATILGHAVKAKTTGNTANEMEVTETSSGGGAPVAVRMVSGSLQIHTASSGTSEASFDSERLRITSAGNIGIGTDIPDTLLHINGSSATQKLITLNSGSSKRNNYIGVNNSDNLEIGADEDDEGNDSSIRFRVDGSEKLRIQSGGGISFNGDTAAANALDDYEEGTWTPTYQTTNNNISGVGAYTNTGDYTKIGDTVIVMFAIATTATSSASGTGDLVITGLPFTAGIGDCSRTVMQITGGRWTNQPQYAIITNGEDNIRLRINFETNADINDLLQHSGNNRNVIEAVLVYTVGR